MLRFAALSILVVLICTPSTVLGDVQPAKTILVQAMGRVDYTPDIASVMINVRSEMPTAGAASDEAATAGSKVIAGLRALGVADNDLQTTGYEVQFQQSNQFEAPRPATYVATESIAVSGIPAGQAGSVIAAAMQAGASEVEGPNLYSSRLDALHDAALAKALDAARTEASKIASHMGVRLGSIYSLEVMDSYMPPSFFENSNGTKVLGHVTTRAAPAIAVGTDRVEVAVQAVYEIR